MPQAFYVLFGALFTVAVSIALGSLLLGVLRLRFHRQEIPVFAFLAGAPGLSLLVFALAAAGQARKSVFLIGGLAAIAAAALRLRGHPAAESLPPLPRFWRNLFGGLFALFTLLYFFNAMAPEMSPDGSTYHLGLVSRYLRTHGFERLTTNMYANLPQGIEMLFLFAFAFGRHSAAALVHFAFLAALPLAMLCYGRLFGFPAAAAAAALFTFVSPVAGRDGTSAYVDVAAACVVFAVFYLLQIWDRDRDPALLAVAGLLAGFAFAVKYTAAPALPYALGFAGWKLRRARKPLFRPLLLIAGCAAVLTLPWLVKNAIWVDNPVSPFFNSVFPNPYVQIAFEQDYARYFRHYDLPSPWQVPLEVTVRGQTLGGLLGPLFLLAPLGLAAVRRAPGRQVLLAAAIFAVTYPGNIGTRFLIPALPFVSLALGLALARWQGLLAGLVAAHAVLSWPAIVKLYSAPYAWRIESIPVRQALRLEPEESWLSRKMPAYAIARLIEDTVPAGETVLAFNPPAEAYTSRNVRVVYQSALNEVLGDMVHTPLIPERRPVWRLRFRFPAQPLRKIRVVQTARGGPDQWSLSELRLYRGAEEVPRAPFWRLRARPNPWAVQMAFDNSAVTRWRSGEVLYPGMFVEVDFARLLALDSVVAESPRDQLKIRLKLEGQDAQGNWSLLAAAFEESEAAPPLAMRRAAMEELKAHRIGYLLLHDFDFGAEDFRKNAVLWGVKPAGERNGARLYEIER